MSSINGNRFINGPAETRDAVINTKPIAVKIPSCAGYRNKTTARFYHATRQQHLPP
jgi:hypothetical protein